MTKVLECGTLVPGCTWRGEAATEDELLAKAAVHAQEAHGMEVTPELAEKVRGAIHDQRA
ncbi:DUF1059 domain-containing protein [Jannaschia formosa]|uniref:DUF1059 domain-containing protein n=1 Tax=Jannaschia formosa TaxID=2259592 RepID=UPI000E1C1460|nr:DUF1059 domain-containing protein [Jannaschia formosa]TFL17453.1 DUF1059 domain-containing protein [Jannaschia formosa]